MDATHAMFIAYRSMYIDPLECPLDFAELHEIARLVCQPDRPEWVRSHRGHARQDGEDGRDDLADHPSFDFFLQTLERLLHGRLDPLHALCCHLECVERPVHLLHIIGILTCRRVHSMLL